MPVHPIQFRSPPAALPEVREYQVVQEPGRLLVRLALRPGSVAERVEEKVRVRFKERLGAQEIACPRLDFEFVDRFERDRSANAKFKLVVSNLRRAQLASVGCGTRAENVLLMNRSLRLRVRGLRRVRLFPFSAQCRP